MALIAMSVYSTVENKKDECLERTLESLDRTVDFSRHRLIISVNGFTNRTLDLINGYETIINDGNIGTAKAINKVWVQKQPGEHVIKMDDDVVIHSEGWVDEMEEAIRRDPFMGQVGLKRKDCWENPKHHNPDYKSELVMLPHVPGERWIVVEKVKHVIGTCVMHSSALIDRVGYLYQPGLYSYDDVIMSHRSQIAGFYNCFLSHINIDHIDEGATPYQSWKEKYAGEYTQEVIQLVRDMWDNKKSTYFPAEW
jgi:GT2 family glycosyltransferase